MEATLYLIETRVISFGKSECSQEITPTKNSDTGMNEFLIFNY